MSRGLWLVNNLCDLAQIRSSPRTGTAVRVHMRTPSFGNLQGLPKMLENTLIADSIAALGSMDFVLGDTDR